MSMNINSYYIPAFKFIISITHWSTNYYRNNCISEISNMLIILSINLIMQVLIPTLVSIFSIAQPTVPSGSVQFILVQHTFCGIPFDPNRDRSPNYRPFSSHFQVSFCWGARLIQPLKVEREKLQVIDQNESNKEHCIHITQLREDKFLFVWKKASGNLNKKLLNVFHHFFSVTASHLSLCQIFLEGSTVQHCYAVTLLHSWCVFQFTRHLPRRKCTQLY